MDIEATVPTNSEGKATLFRKLANVMGRLERVPQNGYNAFHKYPYSTASDVADTIRKALAEEHVAFLVDMLEVHQTPIAKGTHTRAIFRFTFGCGETGEMISQRWEAETDDTGDKGINKVSTVAQKYFLMKTFVVSTGDEPDPDNEEDQPRDTGAQPRASSTSTPSDGNGLSVIRGKNPQKPQPPRDPNLPEWVTTENVEKIIAAIKQATNMSNDEIVKLLNLAKIDDLTLTGWGRYATGKAAGEDAIAKFTKPAEPAKGSKKFEWTDEAEIDMSRWSWDKFGRSDVNFLTDLDKTTWRDYPSDEAARKACVGVALKNKLPMLADFAVYNGEYIEFHTVIPVRAYGRSTTFRKLVGEEYYASNSLDAWEKRSEPYEIETLEITWEEKKRTKSDNSTYLVVIGAKPYIAEDFVGEIDTNTNTAAEGGETEEDPENILNAYFPTT